ncbi:unnamed protein product [Rhizophagus irregularis]|nr:unnamed protein product [Rhizophagus irregularis]
MQEAKAINNNKSYYVYKKAHDSVEKYPIPFQHPAETVILNGIGPTLIQKLERKLKQYCEENRLPMPLRPDEETIRTLSQNIDQNQEFKSTEHESKKQKKATIPKPMSHNIVQDLTQLCWHFTNLVNLNQLHR